jgi:DNA primase
MKFFAKNFPEKLTSSILPSEVVGKRVKLKQHGKEFQGLCPFHNEKSPSFTVNDQKGFYHCFGCQAHGNIIDFVMQTDGLEFKDAVVQLANNFAIEIPWQESKIDQNQPKKDKSYDILEKICQIFEQNLKESIGTNARNYLLNRGFNQKIIKKFRLGYAINSYDFLHEKLAKEGFSESEILKTGIIAKNNSAKIYDKLRNRIIFPILDKKDRVIAFGGRVLGDDLPKYLNSAQTEIFDKGKTLYNISNARKAVFDEKYAIIVEGYADVIALSANGIENVVAGLGTALSKDHIVDLFRITDRVVLCLDGDQAGINAAKRTSEIALPLVSAKKNLDFCFLPKNLDPDDFVKKFGADSLREMLTKNAINFSQALFDFALIELDLVQKNAIKPEEKAKIEEILTKKVDLIKDSLLKKYFSQFFKDILFQIGKKSFNDKKQQEAKRLQSFMKIGQEIIKNAPKNAQSDVFAQNIIALLIKFPHLGNYQDDMFDVKEIIFENEFLTEIKDKIIEKIDENDEKSEENQKNLLLALENYGENDYIIYIKALVNGSFASFENLNDDELNNKMRLLLLKDSFLNVKQQYEQALSRIDDIDTHQSAVIDLKIRELFSYKNALELQILELERQTI